MTGIPWIKTYVIVIQQVHHQHFWILQWQLKNLWLKILKVCSKKIFHLKKNFSSNLASSLIPPPDYFEKIWPLLQQALQAILNGTNSPTNEEQLYRHIDHLCTTTNETNSSSPGLLYENLKKVLHDHIQTLLPPLLRWTSRKILFYFIFEICF